MKGIFLFSLFFVIISLPSQAQTEMSPLDFLPRGESIIVQTYAGVIYRSSRDEHGEYQWEFLLSGSARGPALSSLTADGSQGIVEIERTLGPNQLQWVRFETGDSRVLPFDAHGFCVLSPDGSRVVGVRLEEGIMQMLTLDLESWLADTPESVESYLAPLTDYHGVGVAGMRVARFSPDGEYLLFQAQSVMPRSKVYRYIVHLESGLIFEAAPHTVAWVDSRTLFVSEPPSYGKREFLTYSLFSGQKTSLGEYETGERISIDGRFVFKRTDEESTQIRDQKTNKTYDLTGVRNAGRLSENTLMLVTRDAMFQVNLKDLKSGSIDDVRNKKLVFDRPPSVEFARVSSSGFQSRIAGFETADGSYRANYEVRNSGEEIIEFERSLLNYVLCEIRDSNGDLVLENEDHYPRTFLRSHVLMPGETRIRQCSLTSEVPLAPGRYTFHVGLRQTPLTWQSIEFEVD